MCVQLIHLPHIPLVVWIRCFIHWDFQRSQSMYKQTDELVFVKQFVCTQKIITQNSSSESRKLRWDLFLFYCSKFEQWIQATTISGKSDSIWEIANPWIFTFFLLVWQCLTALIRSHSTAFRSVWATFMNMSNSSSR